MTRDELLAMNQLQLRIAARDHTLPQSDLVGKEVYVIHTVSRTLRHAKVLRNSIEPDVLLNGSMRHSIFFDVYGDVTTNFHGWRPFDIASEFGDEE